MRGAGNTIYEQYIFDSFEIRRHDTNQTALIYSGVAMFTEMYQNGFDGTFDEHTQPTSRALNCMNDTRSTSFPSLTRGTSSNLLLPCDEKTASNNGTEWTECVLKWLQETNNDVPECSTDLSPEASPVCCNTQSKLTVDGANYKLQLRNMYEVYTYECPYIMMRACLCGKEMEGCAFRVQDLQRLDMIDWKKAKDGKCDECNRYKKEYPQLHSLTGGFGGSPLVAKVPKVGCDSSEVKDCMVKCFTGQKPELKCHADKTTACAMNQATGKTMDESECEKLHVEEGGEKYNCEWGSYCGTNKSIPCLQDFSWSNCVSVCANITTNCSNNVRWQHMRGYDASDPVPFRYRIPSSTCPVNAGGGTPRADEEGSHMCNLDGFPYSQNLNTSIVPTTSAGFCTITCGQVLASTLRDTLHEYFVDRAALSATQLEAADLPTTDWIASPNPPNPPPIPPSPPPPPTPPDTFPKSGFCLGLTPFSFGSLSTVNELFQACLCGEEFNECGFKMSQPELVRGGPTIVTVAGCPHGGNAIDTTISNGAVCICTDDDKKSGLCTQNQYCSQFLPKSPYMIPDLKDGDSRKMVFNHNIPINWVRQLWTYDGCTFLNDWDTKWFPYFQRPGNNRWNYQQVCPSYASQCSSPQTTIGCSSKPGASPTKLYITEDISSTDQQSLLDCRVTEMWSQASEWGNSEFYSPFACMSSNMSRKMSRLSTESERNNLIKNYVNSLDFSKNLLEFVLSNNFEGQASCSILFDIDSFDAALASSTPPIWPPRTDQNSAGYNPWLCSAFPKGEWTNTTRPTDWCTDAGGNWTSWTRRYIGETHWNQLVTNERLQDFCTQNHINPEVTAYCPPEYDLEGKPISRTESLHSDACTGDYDMKTREQFIAGETWGCAPGAYCEYGPWTCSNDSLVDCFNKCNADSSGMTESTAIAQFNDQNINFVTECAYKCRQNAANASKQDASNCNNKTKIALWPYDQSEYQKYKYGCTPDIIGNIYHNSSMAGSYCMGVTGTCGYHTRVDRNKTRGRLYEFYLNAGVWSGNLYSHPDFTPAQERAIYIASADIREYIVGLYPEQTVSPVYADLNAPCYDNGTTMTNCNYRFNFTLDFENVSNSSQIDEIKSIINTNLDPVATSPACCRDIVQTNVILYVFGKPVTSGGEVIYIYPEGQISKGEINRGNSVNCFNAANYYGSMQSDSPLQDPVWLAYLNQSVWPMSKSFSDNSCQDGTNPKASTSTWCPRGKGGQYKCPFAGIGKICTPPTMSKDLPMSGLQFKIEPFKTKNKGFTHPVAGTFPHPPPNEDCVMRCNDIVKFYKDVVQSGSNPSQGFPPAPPAIPTPSSLPYKYAVDVRCNLEKKDDRGSYTGVYASPYQLLKSPMMVEAENSLEKQLQASGISTSFTLATGSAPIDDALGSCFMFKVNDSDAKSMNGQYFILQSINTFTGGEGRSFDVQMLNGGSGVYSGSNGCTKPDCACYAFYGGTSPFGRSWTTPLETFDNFTSTNCNKDIFKRNKQVQYACQSGININNANRNLEQLSKKRSVIFVETRCPSQLTSITGFALEDQRNVMPISGALNVLDNYPDLASTGFTTSMLDAKTPTLGYPTSKKSDPRLRVVTSAVTTDSGKDFNTTIQLVEGTGTETQDNIHFPTYIDGIEGAWFQLIDAKCQCVGSDGKRLCT